MVQILTNHVGYDCDDTKSAVFQGTKEIKPSSFEVINYETGEIAFSGSPQEAGEVSNWNTGYYYTLRFDEVTDEGKYYILLKTDKGEYKSFPFEIAYNLLELSTLSDVGYYFKAQRPTGEFEAAEKNLPFLGSKPGVFDYRQGSLDVRGGWFDATGDVGIHLSHLSHTSYFNPQQAAFSTYAFFKAADLLEESGYPYYTYLKRRMLDEGMYGADFLMRMRAPSGSFFRSKCRREAFKPVDTTRAIAFEYRQPKSRKGGGVTEGFDEITDVNYECSLRSGAGYAIAALAYAARMTYPSEFSKEEYIQAAVKAFNYMYENNEKYTNDGKWNLVDEYCTLDAALEIYKTTRQYDYLRYAEEMVDRIAKRYVAIDENMGYLSVNGTDRPYFHAADEGMPILNLIKFCEAETDEQLNDKAYDLAEKLMRFEIHTTDKVNNPFGYAREYVQRGNGEKRDQFFYPHDVETAPWWQGENARIASLACAARSISEYTDDDKFAERLMKYADDQINWVLGLNPFDSCMMAGKGRNLNNYFFEERKDFIHCPGGIINGITSGLHDEDAIEFISKVTDEIKDNWRWAEQWIPHASWFMYALALKRR